MRHGCRFGCNRRHPQFRAAQAIHEVFDFPTAEADILKDPIVETMKHSLHLSPLPAADGAVPPSRDDGSPGRLVDCKNGASARLGVGLDRHCFLHMERPLSFSPHAEPGWSHMRQPSSDRSREAGFINPEASPSTCARAARGYRRFSRIPAARRNLIWKLNIVMGLIWPLRSRISISPQPVRWPDRRKRADQADFLKQSLMGNNAWPPHRLTCLGRLHTVDPWCRKQTTIGFLC